MMNIIIRYERKSAYEVAQPLKKFLIKPEFILDVEEHLAQYYIFGGREAKKSSFLKRLSYPLYLFISFLLILFWLPIRWLFTGEFGYSKETRLSQFVVKWGKFFY